MYYLDKGGINGRILFLEHVDELNGFGSWNLLLGRGLEAIRGGDEGRVLQQRCDDLSSLIQRERIKLEGTKIKKKNKIIERESA